MEDKPEIQWFYGGSSETVVSKKKIETEKHPLVSIIKITDDMDANQIKFFSERNSLIEFIKKLGLMESK